jgi:hypothetical protein
MLNQQISRTAVTTGTGKMVLPEPLIDDPGGAPHSCIDRNGVMWAIPGTGATLHAGIKIGYTDPHPGTDKDPVWADLQTSAAPGTEVICQSQGRHPAEIPKTVHIHVPLL